jgi:hypothetical protein
MQNYKLKKIIQGTKYALQVTYCTKQVTACTLQVHFGLVLEMIFNSKTTFVNLIITSMNFLSISHT